MPYQITEHHKKIKDRGLEPGDVVLHQYSGKDHLFLITNHVAMSFDDICVVSLSNGHLRSLPKKDLELFRGRARIYNILEK